MPSIKKPKINTPHPATKSTIEVTNFNGRLTRYINGQLNSGFAKYATTWGADVFSKPGNLTWNETATQIDAAGSVLTDLIVAGKERVESGISYLYCIGHTARVYKIQVNAPGSYNPSYDNPVLLTTLTSQSPTFTRGGSIDFFTVSGTTYLMIGSDMGVTQLNTDGTGETFIGSTASWTQTVPRPLKQFVGKLYCGNGSNIAEIDTTLTVTNYSKLSPGFPNNTQCRDLDVSVDGNYLEAVVTSLSQSDITSTTADSANIANADSYVMKWNGTDPGFTSYQTFSAYSLTANVVFGNEAFIFGYDVTGSALFSPTAKILSQVTTQAPLPNAVGNGANLVGWATTEYYQGVLRGGQFIYGQTDSEIARGWWRQFAFTATGTETDVVRIPFAVLVSNFNIGSSSNGYLGGIFGYGKGYFSTLETSSAPTTKYKFYKWYPVPTTLGTPVGGVYETQTQLFSKKILVSEVRVYGTGVNVGGTQAAGFISGNSFKIDLIGSDGNPITNASYTFTVGTNLTANNDWAWYNPNCKPTYALGLRVTNLGTANFVISKVEIDYSIGGK